MNEFYQVATISIFALLIVYIKISDKESSELKQNDIFQTEIDVFFDYLSKTGQINPLKPLQKVENIENLNFIRRLQIYQDPEGIQVSSKLSTLYVPYNSEDAIDDYGWGCAWRAIQMFISSPLSNIPIEFTQLYMKFGSLEVLTKLYLHQYNVKQLPQYLKNSNWAPHKLQSGWAEPFIGHLINEYFGVNTRLLLLNGYPYGANAPQEVFEANPVLNFEDFRILLSTNFKQNATNPVMIDNGSYAKTIIGYGYNQQTGITTLWMADPHIKHNNGQEISQLEYSKIGIYSVQLDQTGKLLSTDVPKNYYKYYYNSGVGVLEANDFSSISQWMVLVQN